MRRAVVMVVMMMAVIMVVMTVTMAVIVRTIMVVVMDALMRPAALRAFAEDERLDRDWHGVGGHADAAEIDVVEVAQHHAVDREDLALDQQLLAQNRAKRLRDITIEHDVDGFPSFDRVGEPM